jgi:hypothetical protein
MRRTPRRPTSTVQYSDTRTIKAESLYGGCESAECERRARERCPHCHGEFCLGHLEHEQHHRPGWPQS